MYIPPAASDSRLELQQPLDLAFSEMIFDGFLDTYGTQ